jgi:ABC-type Fe3+ transport system substrate-binding protein
LTAWPIRLLAAGAILALGTGAAHADFKSDWSALVAEAEKEGQLVLYALPNQVTREFVLAEWHKAFPKIAVAVTVTQPPQFVVRIRTERAADKYLWDVAFTGHPAGYVLAKEGALDPLVPEFIDPEVADPKIWGGWKNALVDDAAKYVFATSAYLGSPSYNSDRVPRDKIEKLGLKVMLEPAYKGKTIWQDPGIPGAGKTVGFIVHRELGDAGLRKLIHEQNTLFVTQHHQVIEAMARGTHWFALGGSLGQELEPFTKAGVKTDQLIMFGRTPNVATMTQGGQTLFIFNKRPHPAATRVFVNWVLGKEFQTKIATFMRQGSRRRDVPQVDPDTTPLPGVTYDAPQRESYQAKLDATAEFVRLERQKVKR